MSQRENESEAIEVKHSMIVMYREAGCTTYSVEEQGSCSCEVTHLPVYRWQGCSFTSPIAHSGSHSDTIVSNILVLQGWGALSPPPTVIVSSLFVQLLNAVACFQSIFPVESDTVETLLNSKLYE